MKKLVFVILFCVLFAAIMPVAYAQAPKIEAAFVQMDEQTPALGDCSGACPSAMWLCFDDGSFRQHVVSEDGEVVLFGTGEYTIKGCLTEDGSVLTVRPTSVFVSGPDLAEDDSGHEYEIGEPGFVRVYPKEEEPAIAEDVNEPAIAEDVNEPAIAEDVNEPAIAEDAEDPAAAEDEVVLSDDASDFVLLSDAVPDAILEIRYYSTYNFVGDRIDGYEEPLAFLTKEAAAALREVSDELVAKGYRLKVFDAYRPQKAVTHFVNWALDGEDVRMKEYFYPELDKDVLFPQGYIAEHSGHSRGSTVDLTLFDMNTEKEVDMGGTFDYFGELSHPDYTGITQEQYENRMLLREAMLSHGFKPLAEEWWHFTLEDEPYPDTYFTFPINSDALPAEGTAEQAPVPSAEEMLENMTTEEKVAQMLMPAFQNFADETGVKQKLTELRPEIEETLKKHGFAGVIFFSDNMADTEQAVRLVDAMQTANAAGGGRPQLLTAVDQEGGTVARLGHGCQMPGNMALGAIGDPAAAEQAGRLIGEELVAIGLNYDAAPVVDVNSNPQNPVIGLRSFSDDPELVAAMGTALMRGLRSTGAVSTLKHFPGHGDTATDSHTGLPRIEKSLEELKDFELVPFQACIDAGAEAIMTAHIQYPLIEEQTAISVDTGEEINLPATLSKTILTDLLRGEMGFDGVIISDAMNMKAVAKHFEALTAAQMAIEAGVNILLMPVDTSTPEGLEALDKYISDIAALVDGGTIPVERVDDSVLRILKLKEEHGLLETYDGADLDGRVAHALETVGSKEHHAIEAELAARALTLVKNRDKLLPLQLGEEKTLILVPYDSEVNSAVYVVETLRGEGKLSATADVRAVSYSDFSKADLENVKHLIVVSATYSAGEMDPWTKDGAYSLLLDKVMAAVHEAGGDVTLVSAQLPYDVKRYEQADAAVIAWYAKGMSEDPRGAEGAPLSYGANLPAALMQILDPEGVFPGRLPVKLPDVDPDGHF